MALALETKYIDESWNFEDADTKTLTHCFHNYPAMMIPQVAARLIETYGKNAKLLFDPYCGTGTSLVEANVRNIDGVGTDLNPLARLIAKAKTTPIDLEILDSILEEFANWHFALKFRKIEPDAITLPQFANIDFWFTKEVQVKLALLKDFIEGLPNEDVKRFFYVAFSETVRESSLTRNSEFKLYRIAEHNRKNFNPDVFTLFENKLHRNRKGLVAFLREKAQNKAQSRIYGFNTVVEIPEHVFAQEVDVVVTSPPYGDSRTTVAYGQFSRLANQWLGFKEASKLDKKLMGGQRPEEIKNFGVPVLDETIEQIGNKDEKRAKEVYAFYRDYAASIANISRVVKKGGYACFVVGNRRVKSITLPTDEIDEITVAFFEEQGFKHVETIIRKIPNKRMPLKNSPTNEKGKKESTMNFEYIVVMQKMEV